MQSDTLDRCSHWSQCTEWNRGNVTYSFPLFFWWEIIELLVSVEPHVLKSVHKWADSESRSQPKLSCRDSKSFRPPSGSTWVWLTLVLNPDGGGSPSCITQRRLRTRGLAQRQSHCSVSHSKLWWLWILLYDWKHKFLLENVQSRFHPRHVTPRTLSNFDPVCHLTL